MTSRGKIVLGGTIALYLAGATNNSSAAYAFASALLGIVLMAYVLSRLAASGLKLTWARAPRRAQARQEFSVAFEVSNAALLAKPRSRLTARAVAVSFPGPEEEVTLRLPSVPRGVAGRAELPITLPWRGQWDLTGLRLEGSDPLGLYERRETASPTMALVVTPAFWGVLPMPYTSLLTPAVRQRLSARRPDQGEYRSLREYVPGDDLRRIHWRATAHRNRLMVKEYERPRDLQAQVWLAAVSPKVADEEEDTWQPLTLTERLRDWLGWRYPVRGSDEWVVDEHDDDGQSGSLTSRFLDWIGWRELVGDFDEREMDEGAELALSVAATLAHTFVNAGLPTVLRAPHLSASAQGPGRGGVYWRELLAELGDLPYCSEREVAAGALRWSSDLAPGSSLHLVSNSAAALAAMRATFGGGEALPCLFTGPERETPPWATHVPSYEEMPTALAEAAAGARTKQAAYA